MRPKIYKACSEHSQTVIFILATSMALFLLLSGCSEIADLIFGGSSKPARPVNRSPVYTISAPDLYAEFNANEIRAEQKYKNAIIQLSGVILDIGTIVWDGYPFMILDGDTGVYGGGVRVVFPVNDKDKLAALDKGQYITVLGRCGGLIGPLIMVNDGELVQ